MGDARKAARRGSQHVRLSHRGSVLGQSLIDQLTKFEKAGLIYYGNSECGKHNGISQRSTSTATYHPAHLTGGVPNTMLTSYLTFI